MVKESISMIKNGKAASPSGLVSEMVKSKGEIVVDMILEINHILAEGVILVRVGAQHYGQLLFGKDDALEREK